MVPNPDLIPLEKRASLFMTCLQWQIYNKSSKITP